MRWENLDDPQDFLELFGSRLSEVRNLFLRARELVKFHRHPQMRLYRETTYTLQSLCVMLYVRPFHLTRL